MRTHLSRSGFTLVELLVVIGIISVLISILLPSLSKARDAAKTVQCLSNLRQMSMAMVLYTNQNKGKFPDLLVTGVERWPYKLVQTGAIKKGVVFQCPTGTAFMGDAGVVRPDGQTYPYVHYSYNSQVESTGLYNRAGSEPKIRPVPNVNNLNHPTSLVVLYCSAVNTKYSAPLANTYPGDNRDFYSAMSYRQFGFHGVLHSSKGASTWAFADGHAEQRLGIEREKTVTAPFRYKYNDVIDGMSFDPERPK